MQKSKEESVSVYYSAKIKGLSILAIGGTKKTEPQNNLENTSPPSLQEPTQITTSKSPIFSKKFVLLSILILAGIVVSAVAFLYFSKKSAEKEKLPTKTSAHTSTAHTPHKVHLNKLIHFRKTMQAQGRSDKEIQESLLKVGWKKEIVDYVLRK